MRPALSLALLALLPAAAAAQDGPSFDCAKASSAVEHAICADVTLSAFDRWVGQLYKGLSAELDASGQAALKTEQRAWLKDERNACATAKSQDPSVPDSDVLWSCLYGVYETRAVQLSQALEAALNGAPGPEGPWSGTYSFDDGFAVGSLLLMAMPDGSYTLHVSSVAGPGAHVCDLVASGDAEPEGSLGFTVAETPSCWIGLDRMGDGHGSVTVTAEGCEDWCGANGYFTGDYRAVRPAY